MFEFKKSYFIDRPQQQVFDFISNPENDPEWRQSTISSKWISEPPIGVGSESKSVDKFLGRKLEYTSEITAWDPPSRFGTRVVSGPIPFEATFSLDTEDSGTRVWVEGQAEFSGLFKIAGGLIRRQFEEQMDYEFNTLKQLLEKGHI
jgi:hypothetical protein